MKTSNQLMLIALLVTVASMVAFDFLLKAAYLSGDYKIPFKNYITLQWKDFDIVDLGSSNTANVKFIQGPFSVRIDGHAREYIRLSQTGNRLAIDASFEGNYFGNSNQYLLVISCPTLTRVYAGATYRSNNNEVTDTIAREDWNMRQVLIDGFKQDTLSIVQDYGSTVVLANNTIRSLYALVGKSEGSGSKIILQDSNQFGDATLNIEHKSKLLLENATIQHLSYWLGDSATLVLSGNAQDLLNHSKSYLK
jgi:hypothetical protein